MKLAIPHSPFITHALLLTVIAFSTLNSQLSTVFAQGSLTPPGAPAPTMKSLAQIEPRTPISSAPFPISQPGSYYLTTNLSVSSGGVIYIGTNNVTLDLNGFTLSSTATSLSGIGIQLGAGSAVANIVIRNGFITSGVTNNASGVYGGGGFYDGIIYSIGCYNVRVTGVSVSGCYTYGINLQVGSSSVVESCTVQTVGGVGIQASSVSHSTALQCGSFGIYADIASECRGDAVGSGTGLYATVANNCYGYTTGSGAGLSATVANNCYGYSTGSGTGLSVNGSAIGCFGYSASGIGISAHIANSCMVGGGTTNITYKYNMP